MNEHRAFKRSIARTLLAGAVALVLTGKIGASNAAPPTPDGPAAQTPHRDGAPKAAYVSGTVAGYNLNPMGLPDGLMIESDGKQVQVNCPPPLAAALLQIAPVGDAVKVTGFSEPDGHADHAVYRFVALTNSKGQQIGGLHSAGKAVHLDAVVKQLNYAPTGEADGALLDTGDLVHLSPESATQLKLAVGQKLSIDGTQRPMLLGHNVITAQMVNGFAIVTDPPRDEHFNAPPPPDDAMPPGDGPPHSDAGQGPGPGRRNAHHGPPQDGPRDADAAAGHKPHRDRQGPPDGPPPPSDQ